MTQKTELHWPCQDWHEPDLDRGYIEHRFLSVDEVPYISMREIDAVYKAAKKYARQAEKNGLAVRVDEWTLHGMDPLR